MSTMINADTMKNKLSMKVISITEAVLLPMLIFSLFRMNMATAAPPTMPGVAAEANSHITMDSNACRRRNTLPVTSHTRYMYRKCRTTISTIASAKKPMSRLVQRI